MTRVSVPAWVGLILLMATGPAAPGQTLPATGPATAPATVSAPATAAATAAASSPAAPVVSQPPLPKGLSPLERTLLLAGNDEGLWLVRLNDKGLGKGPDKNPAAKTFDVAAKPVSRKKWIWVTQNALCPPQAIVPLNGQLYLLSGQPPALMLLPMGVEQAPQPLSFPSQHDWPAGTAPLAACGAREFAGVPGESLLALAASPAKAASRPATADAAPVRLYRFSQGQWSVLSELPAGLTAGATAYHMTAAGNKVLVLASGINGSRLGILEDLKWREVAPPVAASQRVLAMMTFTRGVVVAVERAVSGGLASVEIVTLDDAGAVVRRQSLRSEQGVLAWPAGATPLVSRVAQRLAIIAWHEGAVSLVTADTSGLIGPFESTPLAGPIVPGGGAEIIQYFLYALLVAMVLATLMLRPSTPPGQFELPMENVPARLGKRLVAFVIDTLPFMLVLSPLTQRFTEDEPMPLSQEVVRTIMQEVQNSPTMGYAIVATLTAYIIYCTAMEMLLGATVGKIMMHIRVVGDGGRRPDFRGVLMRNLIKVMLLISPPLQLLLGIVFMTRHRQHLGDMVGRTAVVHGWPAPPAPPEAPAPGEQQPPGDGQS
ncbi:MAG: RDD family protein [Phycisphaerae bacterium]